jgi:hypothetical protein
MDTLHIYMRCFTEFIKEYFNGIPIKGAEVGVYTGNNALSILSNVPNIQTLYLIDPYVLYSEWNPCDLPDPPDVAKQKAIEQTATFKEKVKFIYKPFELVNDGEIKLLNFIYIDGCHSYDSVAHDCSKANILVKRGVIGGHDYNFSGVQQAVTEFCKNNNYMITCKNDLIDKGSIDWWVIKENYV